MVSIDSALLNLTEAFCRRFQLLTGRTNVWLAFQLTNLSIVVYFVWTGIYFVSSRGIRRVTLALFCGGLMYLLAQTVFKVSIETHETGAYRRVASGYRNPRRVRDAPLRIAFLTLSVVMSFPVAFVYFNAERLSAYISGLAYVSALLSYSLVVLTTVILYLLACDPLPPCAGRVTEWLRSLIPARLPASE